MTPNETQAEWVKSSQKFGKLAPDYAVANEERREQVPWQDEVAALAARSQGEELSLGWHHRFGTSNEVTEPDNKARPGYLCRHLTRVPAKKDLPISTGSRDPTSEPSGTQIRRDFKGILALISGIQ